MRCERPTLRGAVLALACAALGACAGAPRLPDLERQVPAHWRNDTGTGPAARPERWWQVFGDAQLDALVQRALAQNLTLQQTALRLRAARALAQGSAAAGRPRLGARSVDLPDPATTTSWAVAGLEVQWEPGLFGRAESAARLARADVELAAIDVDAARVLVVAEVVRAYATWCDAQRRAALASRLRDLAAQRVELAQRRRAHDLADDAELARAQAQLAQAEGARAEPQAAAATAVQQLGVLLGGTAPTPTQPPGPPAADAADAHFAPLPAELLRTRPDIRRAEAGVLKAAGELGIARADLYPKLGLGALLGLAVPLQGGATHVVRVAGPAIDIPLFDWGARRAAVDAREAGLQAALLAYRQAVLEGVAETESMLALVERTRLERDAARDALAALRRAVAATDVLVRHELAGAAERIDAAAAAAQGELALAQADAAHLLAYVALYKSVGGAAPPEAAP